MELAHGEFFKVLNCAGLGGSLYERQKTPFSHFGKVFKTIMALGMTLRVSVRDIKTQGRSQAGAWQPGA